MFNNLKTCIQRLTVPEQVDTHTDLINAQEAEANTTATAYIEASKARIIQYEKE
ncbi:hypothetical protein PAMP_008941 [Pampus punctatissimus]